MKVSAAKLRADYEYGLYRSQKHIAGKRGIEWLFTYEVWRKWWISKLGSDWAAKRGRRRHEYCMARKLDRGPYAPRNVDCVTNFENCQTRDPLKGENHFQAKLTEKQVRTILRSRQPMTVLAAQYGVSYFMIQQIQTRKAWKHIKMKAAPKIGELYT